MKQAELETAMIINATAIIEWAKKNKVSQEELTAYMATPEGYQKMIEFSTRVYGVGKVNKLW